MRKILFLALFGFLGLSGIWAAEPVPASLTNSPSTNALAARTVLTNAMAGLPAGDRVWLLGEQLKQLVGDWVNQQGDAGLDLLYYLQEPAKILSDEIKRVDRAHEQEIIELRAEVQALRKTLQELQSRNTGVNPTPAASPGSTNRAVINPATR